jgi:hypothetical protein
MTPDQIRQYALELAEAAVLAAAKRGDPTLDEIDKDNLRAELGRIAEYVATMRDPGAGDHLPAVMVADAARVLAENHPAIDDPHYWRELAGRVVAAAVSSCELVRERRPVWPDGRGVPWTAGHLGSLRVGYTIERRLVIITPAEAEQAEVARRG